MREDERGEAEVPDAHDRDAPAQRADERREPAAGDHEVELTIVTMRFDASDADALAAVLSKYVVLTRMEPGCRNVDLSTSVTRAGRYLVVQKWESPAAQRAHFDGAVMVDMARSCAGLLAAPPDIDLWDALSAHDLR